MKNAPAKTDAPANTVESALNTLNPVAYPIPLVKPEGREPSQKQDAINALVAYCKNYNVYPNTAYLRVICTHGGESNAFHAYYTNRSASMHKRIVRLAVERGNFSK